jgi:hypothetical protein
MVPIEQGLVLRPMHLILRIIDIQKDRLGWPIIRGQKGIEQRLAHTIELTAARGIFRAAHGGLTGEVLAHDRSPITRHLQGRIGSQGMAIVGIFIAAAALKDTLAQYIFIAVVEITRIA